MASLPHAKGVRTRFRNTLEHEMNRGNDIIISDIDNCNVDELIANSGKSIKILKLYIVKLEIQSEKVAALMVEPDPDDQKPLEVIADEDVDLCCVLEIEAYIERLRSRRDSDKSTTKFIRSETDSLVAVQEKMMKKMMSLQTRNQHEFMEYVERMDKRKDKESCVKLRSWI